MRLRDLGTLVRMLDEPEDQAAADLGLCNIQRITVTARKRWGMMITKTTVETARPLRTHETQESET